ncbi:MAG: family 10 glycosylhydrolase [Eubacteriales bacterium]|nr:family 10 glycosylhydrolase [Eubacteriales bacterium]
MKHFIQNIFLILMITILILFSYAYLEKKEGQFGIRDFFEFLVNKREEQPEKKRIEPKSQEDLHPYRAVWVSYLEFNAYRRSAKNNNKKNFSKFFQHILEKSKKCGINRVIVQVRPFGDALYQSGYFPWAACISGTQGKAPGYDPLKVMVKLAHQNDVKIEAWINPYRISSGNNIEELHEENPAKIWAASPASTRNVLNYDGMLYYNPSSLEVQQLIVDGVTEIVKNYEVDGIHMDDYFYPAFTPENVSTGFDSLEYREALENRSIENKMTIAEWRRENVNTLVSAMYQAVKKEDPNVTFGISPAGNLNNLRSDLEHYADIDTWMTGEGYVDYIMPQIYWGYTNSQAPFDKVLKEWCDLAEKSKVRLYIGIQLYRMGTEETQSDYEELQDPSLIQKQIRQVEESGVAAGYCLFSYQYLDPDNRTYLFDSCEFSKKRKKILRKIGKQLMGEGKDEKQTGSI